MTPENRSNPHARSIPVPTDWLPAESDKGVAYDSWWKADAIALAAVNTLNIDADYYWFIESDVVAAPAVWSHLFEWTKGINDDLLATTIGRRGPSSTFRHWDHHGTPHDATRHHIMAVYRLSRRAVEASIAMAPALRETFSEVAVPYVILKNGMTMSDINNHGRFYSNSTMRTIPGEVHINKTLLNHPVKSDLIIP